MTRIELLEEEEMMKVDIIDLINEMDELNEEQIDFFRENVEFFKEVYGVEEITIISRSDDEHYVYYDLSDLEEELNDLEVENATFTVERL